MIIFVCLKIRESMKKLTLIQSELKVPKGNVNNFGNYNYRSAEDILESVKPLLLKYECVLDLSDKVKPIGDKLFLIATATLFDGESIKKVKGYAELGPHKGMTTEQCTGTASSYARKYALNGLFLIDETSQDPDHVQNKKLPPIGDVKNEVSKINTIDDLTNYYYELGSPSTKALTEIFTSRKLEINGGTN